MEQANCTTTRKKHKHILRGDRYVIERMLNAGQISVKTLYNNIDQGHLGITRKDLLRKEGWKQDKTKPRKSLKNLKGESIDSRPNEANKRSEYGHWEMDLILSCKGKQAALLTLTERKTREQIIIKLPNKTQRAVNATLNYIERKHGKSFKTKFKTITTDNGGEFLNFTLLEKSCLSNKEQTDQKRFKMYYAHPYSCWQRGSNENANGIIRRFLPKGTDFGKVSTDKIQAIEDWMNNYPRKILGGISANQASRVAA